jgi:pilus assembly protein CpaC
VFSRNSLGIRYDNASALIDALAQEGLITLLAQPNLTALSGETANFLAGGEFPVPVASTQAGVGVPTITIEWKKFGISLDFIPTVLDGNRINLKVRPEVSQLNSTSGVQLQGFSVPGLSVRRAETTVELGSGETFVIAGLLQRTSENVLSKMPGLGDIPVIGALLRSSRYRRNETELAIIITPYLVKPVGDPSTVAAPTDGFVDADDAQRVLGGEFYRSRPAPTAKAPRP